MDQYSSGCYVVDSDFNVINVNETAKAIYPQLKTGSKCYRCLMNLDSPCDLCPIIKDQKGSKTYMDPIRNIAETVDAVDITIPGHGQCHALIFSTVGSDAEFAATLPTSAEELKNLSLVKALTENYYDLITLRLRDGAINMYRHKGKAIDSSTADRYERNYGIALKQYVSRYVLEEDRAMMYEKGSLDNITKTLKNQKSFTIHYRVVYEGQMHYYFRRIVRIGNEEDFEYVVIGVACEDEAVAAREELQKTKKDLNVVATDSLTGLYTREAFYVRGEELLRRFPQISFDFCILKIQNYELLLHQYSSRMVNPLLSLIGRLLDEYADETTCISYIGEGTFVSVTPNTGMEIRKNNIKSFHNKILEKSEIQGLSLKWSLYTDIPRDVSVAETYGRTSYALSTIRGSMHQDYIEFDQTMLEQMEWEDMVEKGFEDFLVNSEFNPWFQPKFSARDGSFIGAEALARWTRPDGSIIAPDRFIPILERCGKIQMLDLHIFACVCRLLKKLKDEGCPVIPISVNLSRASIYTKDLPERYQAIAQANCIDPKLVPIEITESAAVRSGIISKLSSSMLSDGFVLHMDDFGSGYSSMASLHVIPFECIKIDKTLIDYIGTGTGDGMLKHIISYAKECGLEVVAEGVENKAQYEILKDMGCDTIQGYYFSKPLDQETFLKKYIYLNKERANAFSDSL